MNKTCTFILCEGDSPSGDHAWWNTDGIKERVEDPNRYNRGATPTARYWRVTVSLGQHLFLDLCYEQDGETFFIRTLFKVPTDPARFVTFCQKAEVAAGQAVYDRILGYKHRRLLSGGRYDYTNDFNGEWLQAFALHTWEDKEGELFPANLEEALLILNH